MSDQENEASAMSETGSDVLLSRGLVEQWKHELIDMDARILDAQKQVVALQNRKKDLSRKLQSAVAFIPELEGWLKGQASLLAEQEAEAAADDVALTDAIVRYLTKRGPARPPASRDRIRNNLPAVGYSNEKITANPNYLYTALKRLVDRKIIKEEPQGHFAMI
jgi:hypothetical protein